MSFLSAITIFFSFFLQHYQKDADGLVSNLIKPLTRVGNVQMVVNQNDFVESGWKIPLNDLKMQELIGKGEFSGKSSIVSLSYLLASGL